MAHAFFGPGSEARPHGPKIVDFDILGYVKIEHVEIDNFWNTKRKQSSWILCTRNWTSWQLTWLLMVAPPEAGRSTTTTRFYAFSINLSVKQVRMVPKEGVARGRLSIASIRKYTKIYTKYLHNICKIYKIYKIYRTYIRSTVWGWLRHPQMADFNLSGDCFVAEN